MTNIEITPQSQESSLGALIRERLVQYKQQNDWGLCDPNFVYRNSSDTDVQRTWRKFGWTPQGEMK